MTIYEFFFQSFWHWLGATIWLLIIANYIQSKIFLSLKSSWNNFKKMFKRNLEKELKGGGNYNE